MSLKGFGEKKNVFEFASYGGLYFTVNPGHVEGVPWSRCLYPTLDLQALATKGTAGGDFFFGDAVLSRFPASPLFFRHRLAAFLSDSPKNAKF